jgi:tetratricopeptide (TPR) repeat protein
MALSEDFNQLFKKIKSCPPADVARYAVAIIEVLVPAGREHQIEIAETVCTWAKEQAANKPVLLRYSKLIHAFSLFYTEQYEKALPAITELHRVFEDQHDPDGAAVLLIFQGSIYRTFGNVDLALKSCWSAHEQLSKSSLFSFFFLANLNNIAGIYFDRKHYAESIPYYERTLELAKKLKKDYMGIYAMQGLGKIYLMEQKYPEAKEWFDKAMVTAEQNGVPLMISNSLTELGNYFFTIGQFAEAEDFNKRSLDIRGKNHLTGAAVTNCIRLGEIYIKLSRPDDAIDILEKGLQLAEQIQVKPKMYQIHLLLSEIYERKKDLAKSLAHYKHYHELREQVELEDNERKIKNAHLVFEAEQTKKENIIIKKQKAEIEKKNIELQETIDELTRARIGKKARAITLAIAIILFIMEDTILHFALEFVSTNNYFISMAVKMVIIFSLSPIDKAVEHYLFRRLVKDKKKMEVVV